MTTNKDIESNQGEMKRKQEEEDSPSLNELIKVGYRGSYIRVFHEKYKFQYFYDPLVQLDPNSIIVESNSLLEKYVVRFTIQMWNSEIRAKVFARLKSVLPSHYRPDEETQEEDICVLPFEEVELVQKEGGIHPSVHLMNESKSYLQPSESLNFYFICESQSAANDFAEDFRRNPEFVLDYSKLTLECRGASLCYPSKSQGDFKYRVTTFSNLDSSALPKEPASVSP